MSAAAGAAPAAPALDLTRFAAVFFEEAAEHLATLEELLVALPDGQGDDEDLAAIFRAAHSIKGGAATFGFRDMAGLTHEAESLLDRARRREIELTAPMIDALLAATDELAEQLAAHREGGVSPADGGARLRIRAFLGSEGEAPAHAPRPATGVRHRLEITMPSPPAPGLEGMRRALDELGAGGSAEVQGAELRAILDTTESAARIRETLGFLVEPESVSIVDLGPAEAADGAFGLFEPARPEPADAGYGFFDPPAAADPGFGLFEPESSSPETAARSAVEAAAGPAAEAVAPQAAPSAARRAPADAQSIRVGLDKVDLLINQVGELVVTQAMLAQAAALLDPTRHGRLVAGLRDLERNTRDLQETAMSIRLLPIASVFNRFPRLVRDLAAQLGKEVALATEGEATELDKGVIEKLSDPLTHLVRNAVDHGIEPPERRLAAGKSARGTVTLSASQQGGGIVVTVADDGGGLERGRILAKARERGMTLPADASDGEVFGLIFAPGFSTAAAVTDVSGRGVGMDVVKRNIEALGGVVEVDSAAGAGTRVTVRLPLTLAIIDGMTLASGGVTYVLPLASVVESMQPGQAPLHTVAAQGRVACVRGDYVPVLALADVFPTGAPAAGGPGVLVVVEADGQKVALHVDELLGQQQVVVKSLEAHYRRVPGLSGASIMGDGSVALILDASALARRARH